MSATVYNKISVVVHRRASPVLSSDEIEYSPRYRTKTHAGYEGPVNTHQTPLAAAPAWLGSLAIDPIRIGRGSGSGVRGLFGAAVLRSPPASRP